MPRASEPPIILTPEQEIQVLQMYQTKDLTTIARLLSGFPEIDQRSRWVRAIKEFLAAHGIKMDTQAQLKDKLEVEHKVWELTEEMKKRIEDLGSKCRNPMEVARMVTGNPNLNALSRPYRLIVKHLSQVYPETVSAADEPVDETEYKVPITISHLVGLVNDCVPNGTSNRTYQFGNNMTLQQERQLRALMGYMRVLRFSYQANRYRLKVDRSLYESTFIRFAHDKTDLTQTEVDQYISAAVETVHIIQIERDLQRIEQNISEVMDGDREARGQFMPLVELINATRGKLDQAKGRLHGLLEDLEGSRNNRIQSRDQRNSSILNLFDAVQRSEEHREKLAQLGKKEHEEDGQEVERLSGLDEVAALLAGMTKAEGQY